MIRDQRSFWAESNAQCAIVSFLRRALPPQYRVISVPNGRFKADPKTIARLKREGLTPGVWDLLILSNDGRFMSLEVKADDGKLSTEQREWLNWLAQGSRAFAIVHNVAEAEAALLRWGVPLRGRVAA